MKHSLDPDFVPVFPPRWTNAPAADTPSIGKPRPHHLHLLVAMSFFGASPLAVQVHAPTQRGAYTAALVHARKHHTARRCTELDISFVEATSAT